MSDHRQPAPLLPIKGSKPGQKLDQARRPVSRLRRVRRKRRTEDGSSRDRQVTFTPLVVLLKVDGGVKELLDIKLTLKLSNQRHRLELYGVLARIYHLAEVFRRHPDSWLEFCRQDFWKDRRAKPKPDHADDGLRFLVHQIVAGDKSDDPRKKIYNYHAALSELRTRKIKPKEVVQALRSEGGVKALAAAHAERRHGSKPDADDTAGIGKGKGKGGSEAEGDSSAPWTPNKRRVTLKQNKFLKQLQELERGSELQVTVKIVEKTFKMLKIALLPMTYKISQPLIHAI